MTTSREQIGLIKEHKMKEQIRKEREVVRNLINKMPQTERKHRVDRLQEKFVRLWALQEGQEKKS